MDKHGFCFIIFLLLVTSLKIQCRSLKTFSDHQPLISDGGDDDDRRDHEDGLSLYVESSCDHIYGFLPCADNVGGYVFQIMVFECLLVGGDYMVSSGSMQMFGILGVGIYGGIVFRILMVLSRMMFLLVSAFSVNDMAAQAMVSNGVGSLAGFIIFSLTINWGVCVFSGRAEFTNNKSASTDCLLKKLSSTLTGSGVTVDNKTKRAAGIMLLSLIPIFVVEVSDFIKSSSSTRFIHLITLIISVLALISYFIYQFLDPSVQERSLMYANYEHLVAVFLNHVQTCAKDKLVTENGEPNVPVLISVFQTFDKNGDEHISKSELSALLSDMKSGNLQGDDDAYAMEELMKVFDSDNNGEITVYEFIKGCEKWIVEAKELVENESSGSRPSLNSLKKVVDDWIEGRKEELAKIPTVISGVLKHVQSLALESLLVDGKPDRAVIESLFRQFDTNGDGKVQVDELKSLLPKKIEMFGDKGHTRDNVAKKMIEEFDKNNDNMVDKEEFVEGITNWLNEVALETDHCKDSEKIDEYHRMTWKKAKSLMKEKSTNNNSVAKKLLSTCDIVKASLKVAIGASIVLFLGRPLMANVNYLSQAIGVPSFFISFVVIPLAINVRMALSAQFPASQKTERTASLTFSEMYGGVVMNNILGILLVLAIIYSRDLAWNFSTEVLIILIVGLIIGSLSFLSSTYPLWTCIVAISLYPLSLVLVFFLRHVWGWN